MALQRTAAIQVGRGRFQKLFQESPLPMWVLHARTLGFLAVNQAAVRLYGYTQGEFRALSLASIHPGRQATVPLGAFRRGATTDISGPAEHRRKDGSLIDVELFAHRIQLGDMPAWLVVIQDVTARKEAERLHLQLSAAQEAARLKELMMSTVSHELRTPLTTLRGILTTIISYWDQLVPGEIKQMIVSADKSAQALEATLTDILTLSSNESGTFSPRPEPVDLRAFLDGLIAEQQMVSPTREFRLLAPDTLEIRADPRCLDLMLRNILQNAQKYSPPAGPIHISVDPEGEEVAISIRDFGPGVPSSELELIFQPFYRPTLVDSWRPEGSGLGLAIARAMALGHGGSIRAANAGDGGLVVTIRLPRLGPAP